MVLVLTALSPYAPANTHPAIRDQWTPISGSAIDIDINNQDEIYTISPDKTPWRWSHDKKHWRKMSGEFARVTAADRNRPWAVNPKGIVYRYNGIWWEDKETGVVDVAADALGNVYIAMQQGSVKQWNPLNGSWHTIGGQAKRIAVDSAGTLWSVSATGEIRTYDGKNWVKQAGQARDIAAGADTVAITTPSGEIAVRFPQSEDWVTVPGIKRALSIAITSKGVIWAVTDTNQIVVNLSASELAGFFDKKQKAPSINALSNHAPVIKAPSLTAKGLAALPAIPEQIQAKYQHAKQPLVPQIDANSTPHVQPDLSTPSKPSRGLTRDQAEITATGEITFINTRKTIAKLAIGKDGSVFGLGEFGYVKRWSNEHRRFESFPGNLLNIAVDPAGHPWGVSALGRVFRHDGNAWTQITGAVGSDIAIGAEGTVAITDASGKLYIANQNLKRFSLIPGQGLFVAVDPEGTPWTIRSDGFLQRCNSTPCEVFPQKAKSIAFGPDGTLYIISDQDHLLRKFRDHDVFEHIPTPGEIPIDVAVGPQGLPWIVSDKSIALAATFFERDESGDRTVAAANIGDTIGSGQLGSVVTESSSGFTFTKRMRFVSVPNNIPTPWTANIATNSQGDIWILRAAFGDDELPEKYNPKTDKFDLIPATKFSDISQTHVDFDVNSNNELWMTTIFGMGFLYHETDTQLIGYQFNGGADSPTRVAIAPDDTVYVTVEESGSKFFIYQKAPSDTKFKKFSNDIDVDDIAVGPGHDIWIIQRPTGVVQQWNGKKFINQPTRKQTAKDIDISSNGTIYIVDLANKLRKWNASNKRFDEIRNTSASVVAVDNTGRPWIVDNSNPPAGITVERARE